MAVILLAASAVPLSAQTSEIAVLRAEIAKQQALIAQLLKRIEALEKQPPPPAAVVQDLQDDIKAQEDSINSLREIVNSKVNLNGYYNFSFSADGSDEPIAFQQHHLGVLMAKQLGKFNFLMELELQNVPHHPEITEDRDGEPRRAPEPARRTYRNRHQRRRPGGRRERVDGIQSQPLCRASASASSCRRSTGGRTTIPNLTLSTAAPIYLRELFPAELVGVMVQGSAVTRPSGSSEFGVGYKFYVANNNFEGNSQTDLQDGKSWGGRGQVRFPTTGVCAASTWRPTSTAAMSGLTNNELAEDNVFGFESPARSLAVPAADRVGARQVARADAHRLLRAAGVRLDEDWITFYRVEQLESPRIQRAERRHLAGLNYRPFPQIALKGEFYRSQPLERDFLHTEGEEAQAVQRVRDGGGVLLLKRVARRLLMAGLLVLLWTGGAVHSRALAFVIIVNKANPVKTLPSSSCGASS